MSEPDDIEALAEKIRRGDELSAEETLAVFKTADAAGLLYYKMLTMVREQRSLSELPATLKEIIKTKAWQRWRWVGSSFAQNSLGGYLTSPPPNGVGIEIETVWKLVDDDPEALALLRDAITNEPGHPGSNTDNISNRNKPEHGTSLGYTLDRLKRDHPKLFDRVKAKELSANAAAIEAGFRKKPAIVEVAWKLWQKMTPEQRAEFRTKIDQA
jgi:hypothetical protein